MFILRRRSGRSGPKNGVFDAGSWGHVTPKRVLQEQPWLLYGNHREIRDLEIFRRSTAPRGSYMGTCPQLLSKDRSLLGKPDFGDGRRRCSWIIKNKDEEIEQLL